MLDHAELIATLAAGIGLAFVFGLVASRLRLPPIVGYLLAGVAVGPHTPGFLADPDLAAQLAEVGVILLMFGVGLHFSLRDLLAVRRIAVPGAIVQIGGATLVGAVAAHWLWRWTWTAGIVFGLSLSVASTVVLLRALEERGMLDSSDGRIAVGWLIVEDLATVLALVLLPAFAGSLPEAAISPEGAAAGRSIAMTVMITLAKVTAFVAIMFFVGRRAIPWLLGYVARTGSRELFTLCVLAIALGIAVGAAALFGVSFALGAFFAGVVISESDLSQQAGADALPLQDAFAVLFFVSVGMLFDPMVIVREPLAMLLVILIVVVGKAIAAFMIVLLFGYPLRTGIIVSVGLAQIGEFSFILAALGVSLGMLPEEGRSFILAGSIISITLNPFLFHGTATAETWLRERPLMRRWLDREKSIVVTAPPGTAPRGLRDHAVVVGYGRVGSTIGDALVREEIPFIVIEQDRVRAEALRGEAIPTIYGNAARPTILAHAHIDSARLLVIAAPEPHQARQIIQVARQANPEIDIVVRTHSRAEMDHLQRLGVGRAVMGERELAFGMAHYALRSLGRTEAETDAAVHALRVGHL